MPNPVHSAVSALPAVSSPQEVAAAANALLGKPHKGVPGSYVSGILAIVWVPLDSPGRLFALALVELSPRTG